MSASAVEQAYLCPGSRNAQEGLPELDAAEDVKESGIRIHAALAGDTEALLELSSEEQSTYEHMSRKAHQLVERHGFDTNNFIAEERIWFNDDFSGQPDRVYLKDGKALCIDFKSGFLPVTTAPENPQLATLAILVIHKYGVAEVTVAIIPRFGAIKETATYTLETAGAALLKIQEIIAAAEIPDAPRVPGERQCKYCRARLRCPERLNLNLAVSRTDTSTIPALTGAELSVHLGLIPRIEAIVNDLRAEAKRRLKANEDVPGYFLKDGTPRETIVELPEVFERVKALGVTLKDFQQECGITKGEAKKETKKHGEEARGLKGLIWKATGLYGKALDEMMDQILDGCVEVGEKPEPQLKRKE